MLDDESSHFVQLRSCLLDDLIDFADLESLAAEFDLIIDPAHELETAVMQDSHQVTRPVNAVPIFWQDLESLLGEFHPVQVTLSN
jgi:hypothetical protein